MRLSWRDGETLERCKDMEFIFYGREGGAMIEGMERTKQMMTVWSYGGTSSRSGRSGGD